MTVFSDLMTELLELRVSVKSLDEKLEALQPAIPDGWKLVPMEPTEEMCLAYTKHKTEAGEKWARHQWAAMLAAAPEPSK